MNDRDTFLLNFRGSTIGSVTDNSSDEESFQNEVLRPILKLQNDLLIAVFTNYLSETKSPFYFNSPERNLAKIENAIQKDVKLRNTLKGIVIALFSNSEFLYYSNNSSRVNKRIITMLTERLKSQVQLFTTSEL